MAERDDSRLLLRFALVLALAYVGVLSSIVLPEIALDGWFADLAVRISDTASWRQLPVLAIVMMIVVVSRPGIESRRRALEACGIAAILLLILAGNAELNESVIKPVFAVPRPNLVALADHGVLGIGVDEFYALGDKQVRRDFLAPRLDELVEPPLSPTVREHWLIETGFSFPSGHSTAAMTFATLMLAIGLRWTQGWRQWLTTLLPIWAVTVVYTRPLLRVHTYLDVSVGAAVGIGLGTVGFAILHKLIERRRAQERGAA
jgi:phosphatidylglycerophosphatase B